MAHPHILNKTFAQITSTTRFVLERLYEQPSRSIDDAHTAFDRARGVMDLWSELIFDMGLSEHINLDAQSLFESATMLNWHGGICHHVNAREKTKWQIKSGKYDSLMG